MPENVETMTVEITKPISRFLSTRSLGLQIKLALSLEYLLCIQIKNGP